MYFWWARGFITNSSGHFPEVILQYIPDIFRFPGDTLLSPWTQEPRYYLCCFVSFHICIHIRGQAVGEQRREKIQKEFTQPSCDHNSSQSKQICVPYPQCFRYLQTPAVPTVLPQLFSLEDGLGVGVQDNRKYQQCVGGVMMKSSCIQPLWSLLSPGAKVWSLLSPEVRSRGSFRNFLWSPWCSLLSLGLIWLRIWK